MEQGFKLVRTRLEAILGRPALVRETSHKGFGNVRERLREWVERARRGDAVGSWPGATKVCPCSLEPAFSATEAPRSMGARQMGQSPPA